MSWQSAVEAHFGCGVTQSRPLAGGDLSEIHKVTLADGRCIAVKHGPSVEAEARMLASMAVAGAPVPQVLWSQDDVLCLDWLEQAAPTPQAWAQLGQDLRALHEGRNADYGWPEDYAFGPLPIDNTACADWPDFWAERRLRPFVPLLPEAEALRIDTLCQRLPDLLPAHPAPALLHGDLWTGNTLFADAGAYLIDPACYHGDGEVDLAMLDLFGPPHPAFHEGYGATPGREGRRAIYQLFPALVHLRLFGSGYQALVTRLLDEALS